MKAEPVIREFHDFEIHLNHGTNPIKVRFKNAKSFYLISSSLSLS